MPFVFWRRYFDGDFSCFDTYMTIKLREAVNALNVDLIFQIAGLGIIITVLNQLLGRAGRDEMALLVTIAGLAAALVIVSKEISDLFNTIKLMFGL